MYLKTGFLSSKKIEIRTEKESLRIETYTWLIFDF